jgi:hypothetical protein
LGIIGMRARVMWRQPPRLSGQGEAWPRHSNSNNEKTDADISAPAVIRKNAQGSSFTSAPDRHARPEPKSAPAEPLPHARAHYRIKHGWLKMYARDLGLNPRSIRLDSSQGSFFPRRHLLDPGHPRLASSHLRLEARHSRGCAAGRGLLLRGGDFGLCQEPIRPSRSQSKHRTSAALDSFDDQTNIPAGPCRAAVVTNPIQSQRQNPSRQPSPTLYRFHRQ